MGEHSSWFDFLYLLPGFDRLAATAEHELGRGPGTAHPWKLAVFDETSFTLTHVLACMLVTLLLAALAIAYRGRLRRAGDDALVPSERFGLAVFFEMMVDGILSLGEGIMGKKNAVRFLPLVGSLAFFIFFSNAISLIPGFAPPTDTIKTNLALAGLVFLATHYYGVREHGIKYLKHFLGPVWWLSPLMLPIELISHIARPVSLTLRLMGNMASDHKVVAAFFALIPLLVPLPFLLLGMVVVVVQTLVFTLLTMVYISMAVAHEEH